MPWQKKGMAHMVVEKRAFILLRLQTIGWVFFVSNVLLGTGMDKSNCMMSMNE